MPPIQKSRHSIRLKEYDYSQAGAYFFTIVTHDRANIFGEITDNELQLNAAGESLWAQWNALPERYPNIELDEFIVMPNHIHGILLITETPVGAIHELPLPDNYRAARRKMLLPKIMGYYKMNTAKRINLLRGMEGNPLWQRNYWEHIIRNENELNRIRHYIITNPAQWESDDENPDKTK